MSYLPVIGRAASLLVQGTLHPDDVGAPGARLSREPEAPWSGETQSFRNDVCAHRVVDPLLEVVQRPEVCGFQLPVTAYGYCALLLEQALHVMIVARHDLASILR